MPSGLITHADKVLFAERGETKGDLAEHYQRVAEPLMRTMGGRPVLLQRFPEGAGGPSFFQKRVPKNAPDWLQTTTVSTPNGTTSQALVAADLDHVLWAVNLGCLGFHVWPYLAADPTSTPTSCGSTSTRRRASTSPRSAQAARELQRAARRARHHRVPQDDRQPRPARLRPARSRAGTPTRSARRPSRSRASWSGAGPT